ncbi:hypothetical protein MAHJHV47_43660 [Mycobacterium avium subsp. hominissuis]
MSACVVAALSSAASSVLVGTAPVHRAAVTVTEWGLRGTRSAEVAAAFYPFVVLFS